MTNAEIIATIRAEIERREKSLRAGICNEEVFTIKQRNEMLVASEELDRLNRLLSDLEKSEKPMNQEGLVEEVKRYYSDNFAYISSDQPTLSILTNVARHFAKWGEHNAMEHLRAARRAEEAYQEVAKEMRKQIADDEELEEEIDRMVKCEKEFINFKCKSQLIAYIAHHFAQWGAKH